jgi:phosphoribosylformimino-5-aminoimidazole carboxamide ribotide isomerase
MKIIPAIDIIEGKCVRLVQGNFGNMKVYHEDPLEVAQNFENEGFEYIHVVDLDGARKGKVVNWKVLEKIAEHTVLKVDFGGGVKTAEEIERLLGLGFDYINIGSIAVQKPELFRDWVRQFGADNFILSADVEKGTVKVAGWKETDPIRLLDLIRSFEKDHINRITCTAIEADGMLNGPNLLLYKKLRMAFPTHFITASGGIAAIDELLELQYLNINAAIIGKALYEKRITADQLKNENLL